MLGCPQRCTWLCCPLLRPRRSTKPSPTAWQAGRFPLARASTNLDISLPLFRKLIRLTPRPTVFTTWCGTDDELLVGATGEVPVAHQLRLRALAENGFAGPVVRGVARVGIETNMWVTCGGHVTQWLFRGGELARKVCSLCSPSLLCCRRG